MNIFKLQPALDFTGRIINPPELDSDIFSVRFGREILLFADKLSKDDFGQGLTHIYSFQGENLETELYIVVQKGRLFQQHYPNVPVIYDRGRYLLVRIDSDSVKKLQGKNKTCYDFIPLKKGQTVFEELNLAAFRRTPPPYILSLVNKLRRDSLEEVLKILTSFRTRFSTSPEYMKASSLMKARLGKQGYKTQVQPFEMSSGNSQNIIAEKPGTGIGSRNVIIVTAHLDSIGEADGNDVPAPGADDNGSGCAGLMEIARIFQNHQGEHDLRLILFGGEEKGFIGSAHYVNSLCPLERSRIKAVVNMDMIGFLNSPGQKVLIEGHRQMQQVIDGLVEAAATYTTFSSVETSFEYNNSDHVSFIRERIPAALTIEGAENTNPNIHSAKDTINTVKPDFALKILRMNVGYIAKEIGSV